jgi:micrococcal nuclease
MRAGSSWRARWVTGVGLVALALACTGGGRGQRERAAPSPSSSAALPPGTVLLDGVAVEVRWSDGDTFSIQSGPLRGTNARLTGFNTLEDYGPVHRWGQWTPRELLALAHAPTAVVTARGWSCASRGDRDRYGRLLVDCPEVAEVLTARGLAMVFAIDGAAEERLVKAQRQAQAGKEGMWRKGVPPLLVTSVHSLEEGRGYNRVVDTRTGVSRARAHHERYRLCQEVCEGPPTQPSCMLYVPFERRYKDKPECLR